MSNAINEQVRERLLRIRVETAALERLLRAGNGNKQLLRYVADITMSIGSLEILLEKEDAA